jgi:hypothetical protein
MPSTYSTSLGLELIGNGEQAGTWGTTTNTNLGTLLEQAIAGVQSITLPGGDYTLTDFNGLPDEARNAVLVFGGLLAAPCNVIAPAVEKVYIVRNFSNATVTVKASGGNGVAIANAASEVIFCDGTNFFSATQFNYIDGNLVVTGTATANNLVATNNITLGKDLFANSSTGQVYLPRGNTAARTASPITGVIRYNTEANFYEGYANGSWVRFLVANQGSYTITYVIVGGGGGGQNGGFTGAGGGGQFVTSTTPAIPATTVLTITIGAGGAAQTIGSATLIVGVGSAIGGSPGYDAGGGTSASHGGASGNGYAGSQGLGSAGGGGSGGATSSNNGGVGTQTLISGTSVYYAGGGGGGSAGGGAAGAGSGTNGGGNGGWATTSADVPPDPGSPNTGGGGGGAALNFPHSGGQGGSGIVVLSMPTVNYTGVFTGSPAVTTTGSNTILTYTGSGTYTA